MKINHNQFLNLAFNIAKINLGKTKLNPSVGCVIVKDNSVISTGLTSLNGRPHAEFNALKIKKNFKNSDLYSTMEPCVHYGFTPPCTNLIKKKKIKRVYYSFNDFDERTSHKAKKILKEDNIKVKRILTKSYEDFYKSYYCLHKKQFPYVDAKIAVSKDFFTINSKNKWITNNQSRKRVHLLRSEYDCILSTSKTVNKDNSLLNCRLEGFDNNKPDLIIIDLKLKIKTNLKLFKLFTKRKIFIVTKMKKNKKSKVLMKKGVQFINIENLESKRDFEELLMILKKKKFNRIFVETGLKFLKTLFKNNIIFNLFMFQSSDKINNKGFNNVSAYFLKKFRNKKRINVNLNGDNLYKVKIK